VWDRSDFEYELQRLVEDAGRIKEWVSEDRSSDAIAGLERIISAQLRLHEKLRERFDIEDIEDTELEDDIAGSFLDAFAEEDFDGPAGLPPLDALSEIFDGPESLPFGTEQHRCRLCGQDLDLRAFISSDVIVDETGWHHRSCLMPTTRRFWPRPSEN